MWESSRLRRTARLSRAVERVLKPGEEVLTLALGSYDPPLRPGLRGFLADMFTPRAPNELLDGIVVTDRRVLIVALAAFRAKVTRTHVESARALVVLSGFDRDPRRPALEFRLPNGSTYAIDGERGQIDEYRRVGELLRDARVAPDDLPAPSVPKEVSRRALTRLAGFSVLGFMVAGILVAAGAIEWGSAEATGIVAALGVQVVTLGWVMLGKRNGRKR